VRSTWVKILVGACVLAGVVAVWVFGVPLWHLRRWENQRTEARELAHKGQYAEAEKKLVDAVGAAESFGATDRRLDDTVNELAKVYADEGKYSESQALYLRSLEARVQSGDKADMARSFFQLGETYLAQQNLAAAEGLFNQSIAAWQESATPDNAEVAFVLVAQAQLLSAQGRPKDAEPFIAKALAIREKVLPANDPELKRTVEVYAVVLRGLGQTARAQAMETRAAGAAPSDK
jgi:tetratricopeptide (TPR) repeat protein